MRRALLTALAVVLLAAACGGADDERVTLAELERELVCPTCNTTLGLSNAPVADRMRAIIRQRIAAGASAAEKLALFSGTARRVYRWIDVPLDTV